MKYCEGFPEIQCPNAAAAVFDMLGYRLCERCADNWRQPLTRGDEHAGAQIVALREQLNQAHAHIGALLSIKCGGVQTYEEIQRDRATQDAARAWLQRKAVRG